MKPAAYTTALHRAHALRVQARNLVPLLKEAIAANDHADAVGPVLDPTAYRDRHERMLEDREVLQAVLDLGRLGPAAPEPANVPERMEPWAHPEDPADPTAEDYEADQRPTRAEIEAEEADAREDRRW